MRTMSARAGCYGLIFEDENRNNEGSRTHVRGRDTPQYGVEKKEVMIINNNDKQ